MCILCKKQEDRGSCEGPSTTDPLCGGEIIDKYYTCKNGKCVDCGSDKTKCGNEVYANPDYKNDWRGKGVKNFLGEDLPEGTYYYIVRTIDRNGVSNKFAGPLTIIR
jgi:hypothetical protein